MNKLRYLAFVGAALLAGCGSGGSHPSSTASPTPTACVTSCGGGSGSVSTKGWKTYSPSDDTEVSFTYPSAWKLTIQPAGATSNGGATVTAPDGTTVQLTLNVSGLGGACVPPEPSDTLLSLTPVSGSQDLDVITLAESASGSSTAPFTVGLIHSSESIGDNSQQSPLASPYSAGMTFECAQLPVFPDPEHSGAIDSLVGLGPKVAGSQLGTVDIPPVDLPTVRTIVGSARL